MLPAGIPLAPVLPGQPSNRGASEESQQEPRELPSGAVSWEGSTRTQGNAAWRNWLTAPLNTCITRDEVLVLGRELAALLWGWIARGRVIFILGGPSLPLGACRAHLTAWGKLLGPCKESSSLVGCAQTGFVFPAAGKPSLRAGFAAAVSPQPGFHEARLAGASGAPKAGFSW